MVVHYFFLEFTVIYHCDIEHFAVSCRDDLGFPLTVKP